MTATDVLIIGAGPAGLTLALALLENGVKVRIIEKMPTTRVGSRGNGIMPRTLEALKLLGVVGEVLAQGVGDITIQPYRLPGGVEKLPISRLFPKEKPTPAITYPNAVALGQELLEGILIKAIVDRFGVKVEYAKELVSFKSTDDLVTAQLHVTAADGTTSSEVAEAKHLVGTDGGHSRVRKQLGFAFEGEALTGVMIIGDIQVDGLDPVIAHAWFHPTKGRAVIFPTSQKHGHPFALRIMLPVDYPEPEALARDSNAARTFIQDLIERKDVTLGEFTYLSVYRAHARMVDRFSDGKRVFLAGDAAHCHSPAGAQGLNSSVQDSINLAWKLAAAVRGRAAPTGGLLDSYNTERVPVIASMLNRTTIAFKMMMKHGDEAPSESDSTTTGTARNEIPRFDQDLNQLGVHYKWSDIVVDDLPKAKATVAVDDAAGGDACAGVNAHAHVRANPDDIEEVDVYTTGAELHAGDRAPNATGLISVLVKGHQEGEDANSLFDHFSPSHHVGLVFVSNGANMQDVTAMLNVLHAIGSDLVRPTLVYAASSEIDKSGLVSQVPGSGGAQMLVDRDEHAFAAYKPQRYGSVSTAIIRPDGVIGAMVCNPRSIRVYFGKIYT